MLSPASLIAKRVSCSPEDDAVIGTINSEDAGCVLETLSDEFIEVEN